MSEECLTDRYFAEGICIGCGPANPKGFHTRFFYDPDVGDRVIGRLVVPEHATGLPDIVQGGVLFTVLDCLTAWTLRALDERSAGKMPVSMSATIRFHKPARIGQALELVGTVLREATGPQDPVITRGEARDDSGALLADMEAQMALLPLATFKKIVGITELPAHYHELFSER